MSDDKTRILPMDFDSDDSLPGRFEESNNSGYFDGKTVNPRSKNRIILVIAVASVIVSSGFFAYYFINQNDIDSQIIQNTMYIDPERQLINQYGVGEYGSDHAHAAILVFVNDQSINFGLPPFQLSSKYIHFENHNPYLIHKHATNVPMEMLFASLGMKITHDCIILNYNRSADDNKTSRFCTGEDQSLMFYVNGEKYPDISKYVLEHNDRILISLGDAKLISKHLAYLESLKILDVPKKTPEYSEDNISVWLKSELCGEEITKYLKDLKKSHLDPLDYDRDDD